MKPNRIILVRHGESIGNIDRTVYKEHPDYRIPLTKDGRKQAEKCGHKLREITRDESCFFYVSPFWRTRETFKEIRKSFARDSINFIEEPRLREQEWGHLRSEGYLEECKKERDDYGQFYFRIPNGESGADVYDRVSDFFGTLHRDFRKDNFPQNCIIVSHGITIKLFLMKWFHWTVEEFENIKNPKNCQIIILSKQKDHKYKLISELAKKQ